MRLLDTSTLTFREFIGVNIPKYAILSHRWGEDEVTYKEMRKGTATAGAGLEKIHSLCRLAASRGFGWCWIDTCCIDKRSSAELTEAINSMYIWYRNADACYVHLKDVELSPGEIAQKDCLDHERAWLDIVWPGSLGVSFSRSAWFSRGWTLQELLAPSIGRVFFFDNSWIPIVALTNCHDEVAAITGIEGMYLRHGPFSACVAQKMSWASRRQTTREEDMAYCLLGLFNVNMPLLYGEGLTKAFRRLQLEIMAEGSDESLFAWSCASWTSSGMLAATPADFAGSADIRRLPPGNRPSYSMTNKGLDFALPERHLSCRTSADQILAILFCCRAGNTEPVAIELQVNGPYQFRRLPSRLLSPSMTLPSFSGYTQELLMEDLEMIVHVYLQ